MMNDNFLKVAKKAALEAGKVILKYSGNYGKRIIKEGDKSNFVTKADLEAEKVIIKTIQDNFLEHNILSEEIGEIDKGSEYTWVIDPIDGTITFASGLPYFTVSIGLLSKNMPIIGVIYQVIGQELYWAQKDKGAFLNGKKISVTNTKEFKRAVMATDFGHVQTRQNKINRFFLPLANKASYFYSIGSDAYCLALIARGLLDGFTTDAWVWDHCAGAVLITEAGGKLTDLSGNQIDWTKKRLEMVASNGLIHDQILEALKKS